MREFALTLGFHDAKKETPNIYEWCIVAYRDEKSRVYWQRGLFNNGKWVVPSRKADEIVAWSYLPPSLLEKNIERGERIDGKR